MRFANTGPANESGPAVTVSFVAGNDGCPPLGGSREWSDVAAGPDALTHGGLQHLPALLHELFVRRVYLDVGERAFGMAIGERVSHALLSGRHVLAAKNIEQLHALEVCRFRLFDDVEHGLVRR